jgi:hypothetical protein
VQRSAATSSSLFALSTGDTGATNEHCAPWTRPKPERVVKAFYEAQELIALGSLVSYARDFGKPLGIVSGIHSSKGYLRYVTELSCRGTA